MMTYHFSDIELKDMGEHLALIEVKKQKIEEEKKIATKDFNDAIKIIDLEIESLSQKISLGFEDREENLFQRNQSAEEQPVQQ